VGLLKVGGGGLAEQPVDRGKIQELGKSSPKKMLDDSRIAIEGSVEPGPVRSMISPL
jgi:hypothetical protein